MKFKSAILCARYKYYYIYLFFYLFFVYSIIVSVVVLLQPNQGNEFIIFLIFYVPLYNVLKLYGIILNNSFRLTITM